MNITCNLYVTEQNVATLNDLVTLLWGGTITFGNAAKSKGKGKGKGKKPSTKAKAQHTTAASATPSAWPTITIREVAARIDISVHKQFFITHQIDGPQHLVDALQVTVDDRGNLTICGNGPDLSGGDSSTLSSRNLNTQAVNDAEKGRQVSTTLGPGGRLQLTGSKHKVHIHVWAPEGTPVTIENA